MKKVVTKALLKKIKKFKSDISGFDGVRFRHHGKKYVLRYSLDEDPYKFYDLFEEILFLHYICTFDKNLKILEVY